MHETALVIFCLILIGFGLYMVERFIPMVEPVKLLIRFVLVLGVAVWLWNRFSGGHIFVR